MTAGQKKGTHNIVHILILFLIVSCDYQSSKEFINELAPPSPYLEINLQLLPQKDTIDLFLPIVLKYNFSYEGKRLMTGHFKLGAKEWEIKSLSGNITLSPEDYEPGFHNLSLKLILSSATGSIADQLGAEGYLVEKDWVVKSDFRQTSVPNIRHFKNEDGFLVISWDAFDYYNFDYYEIIRDDWEGVKNTIVITDPSQTTYIDSCFFGKGTYYYVSTKVIGPGSTFFSSGRSIYIESETPEIEFELLGYDSVRVKWSQTGYPTRYTLMVTNTHPGVTYLEASKDTSIVIVSPKFGESYNFELSIMSGDEYKCNNITYPIDYKSFAIGQRIAWNSPKYGYNFIDKILYTNTYDEIIAYDIENFEIINTSYVRQLLLGGVYSSPLGNTSLAAASWRQIYVFENKNLKNPTIIDLQGKQAGNFLFLTPNNELAATVENEFRLYNVGTKELITSFDIVEMPYYSSWAGIGTSLDAGFAGITTHNGIWLYHKIDNKYEEIYHDDQSYRSILFDPVYPDKVFVTKRDDTELICYNLPGFNPDLSWSLPNSCVICNIDPHTGYMLLRDDTEKKLHILNLETGQIIFSIYGNNFQPRLYNNRLLSSSGYAFDISKFLP